jgi:tRNA-specific 2-thiouridylase
MKERVVVAMSGGVDSSVAAALLNSEGYEVIGITMCFNLPDASRKKPSCCGIRGIEDARRVSHQLNIRHYVLNMQKVLREKVIKDFCQEYIKGRTPNPCIRCNQFIKFDALLQKALSLDARFLATGHYAKIVTSHQSPVTSPTYLLKKGKDKKKDQSYFLYRLGQKQLKYILFPLGSYTKNEVRNLARKYRLPVADKLASQEICFLPEMDYRGFLKQMIKKELRPGLIVDQQGKTLGEHKGIAYYTIGQRQGLGIAKGYPVYITKIDAKTHSIMVGRKEDCKKSEFLVKEVNYISRPLKKKIVLGVKIRYNHKEARALVTPLENKIKVKFRKAQFAITPGQSAVFYDGDRVVAGGIIDRVLD